MAAAASAAAIVVGASNPYEPGHFPTCPVLALTGYFCTGCGTLRAVHSLLHVDLAGAWDMNPLLLLLAPFALATWVAWTVRAWTGRPRSWAAPPWAIWVVLVLLVGFTVGRNVPALAPWLAP